MTEHIIFRYDFMADRWQTAGYVTAENEERAIRIHVQGPTVPELGNYIAVPRDEFAEFMRPRLEVRVGLELTAKQGVA